VIVIALSQFYVHPSQLWVKVINVVHYGQQLGLEFWVGTKCGGAGLKTGTKRRCVGPIPRTFCTTKDTRDR